MKYQFFSENEWVIDFNFSNAGFVGNLVVKP